MQLCWQNVEDPDGDALRYRVFLDDVELTEGKKGEQDGYDGPCLGPLLFAHERSYSWRVQAFEVDDPTQQSEPSETWSFTTASDGESETVFFDRFDEDLGWVIDGDAATGAWERGDPVPTLHGDPARRAQPGRCFGGFSCLFTGQNPDAIADQGDVDGGQTRATSPAFDLSGATGAVSVRLSRFFYRSEPGVDASLRVELLTPNDEAPEGYDLHLLELLEQPTSAAAHDAWLPREYLLCDAPAVAGVRLRLTATDLGEGVLEAAIDSVSVHAYADATVCTTELGGACDPSLGDAACAGALLCCSQGQLEAGVHRCEEAAAGLDFESPPASPDEPGNGPLGCNAPDLVVDGAGVEPFTFSEILITEQTCELLEGCVDAAGWRRVMLFTVPIANIGARDLALGVPVNNPDIYHYSDCHEHYHFDEFARYELTDSQGQSVVATGHKQAFCLLDTISWAWPFELAKYDCANQGISRGFSDFYESGLPCQWIDITGLEPGDYLLRIILNPLREDFALPMVNERDVDNNVLELPVEIPAP
nr:lysyl oxidase family protein [Pseudenhygromyxa sp. WMMC2535]